MSFDGISNKATLVGMSSLAVGVTSKFCGEDVNLFCRVMSKKGEICKLQRNGYAKS